MPLEFHHMSQAWYIHKFADWGTHSNEFAWYKLNLPEYGEPDFYRQARSFNAFFHTWNKKLSNAIKKHGMYSKQVSAAKPNHTPDGFLLMARPEPDFEMEKAVSVKCGADQSKVDASHRVVEEFPSIWAFYDYIGFDYKTRKYRTEKFI